MNLLATARRRTILLTCLYAAEGAPIGFLWWALPALLRARGVEVERITSLLALLVVPWTLKFLWAPAVDALAGPRFGLRSWIVVAQSLMAAALVPLVWLDPAQDLGLVTAFLLVHAVAAATQDVAVDGLAVRVLAAGERGHANGAMQAGMLLGRSLFGGGALAVAATFGWNAILLALVAAIATALLLVAGIEEPPRVAGPAARPDVALRQAFARRTTWIGLGFALVGGAGFEATGALTGPYLVDRGVDESSIGIFLGVPVVLAMALGGLVGGRLADRRGHVRTLVVATLGFVIPILVLASVDSLYSGTFAREIAFVMLAIMYAFAGVFVAASYALFMDLTDPRVGATQFSTFMAATNGCESWATWWGGRAAGSTGYATGFAATALVSLAGLPLLALLGGRRRAAGPCTPERPHGDPPPDPPALDRR